MGLSIMTFALMVGLAVLGLMFLNYYMYRENAKYNQELEFFLKHRIIAHNRVKARLAVFTTRYERLESENRSFQEELSSLRELQAKFDETLGRNEFLENKTSEYQKLEIEISSIQEMLNGNMKDQLSNYMKEVEGITQRLDQATLEFNENTKSFEKSDIEEAA